jgi:acetyltransferase-like isoleucine patch superfamily enzyme
MTEATTDGTLERAKKRIATWVLRLGIKPYKALNKWGNSTLGYEIGEYTYGVPRVVFPEGRLKIGKFCSIAWNVTIYLGGNHRTDWIAMYPFPTPDGRWPGAEGIEGYLTTRGDVTIGNDVWIGSDVIIMSDVTVGDGAVIGAGSVVTADVEPFAIVAGNPAKTLKKRFPDEVAEKLLEIKWWDWPYEKINNNLQLLCSGDIEKLMEIT